MGINVVEACRVYGWSLVVAGSVCEYPEHAPIPMVEENLWEGKPEPTNAPYGISKRAILAMQQAYYKQYGLESAHILQANLYGPGDNFDDNTSHVIPALIKRFIDAKENGESEVVVWGSGKATRDFLYVDDAADAYIRIAENLPTPYDPINIGTGFSTSIAFIANKIKELTGFDGKIVYDKTKPDGQMRRQLRIAQVFHDYGWEPKVMLVDGLENTIRWYEENR